MEKNAAVDISISIINHNSTELLISCLRSLEKNLVGLTSEIFVVDNLCEDQAKESVEREFPNVKVLSQTQANGFSTNHNQALRMARGRYVLVLNPDSRLPEFCLPQFFEFMDHNPSAGVCGPKLVDSQGVSEDPPKRAIDLLRDLVLCALYISNASPERAEQIKTMRNWRPKRSSSMKDSSIPISTINELPRQAETLVGACLFLRKSALDDVGLFDERYFLYCEEVDWCVRARQCGWGVYYIPAIEVLHIGGQSTKKNPLRYLLTFVESKKKFYRKHRGVIAEYTLRMVLTVAGLINYCRWGFSAWLYKKSPYLEWLAFTKKLLKLLWT